MKIYLLLVSYTQLTNVSTIKAIYKNCDKPQDLAYLLKMLCENIQLADLNTLLMRIESDAITTKVVPYHLSQMNLVKPYSQAKLQFVGNLIHAYANINGMIDTKNMNKSRRHVIDYVTSISDPAIQSLLIDILKVDSIGKAPFLQFLCSSKPGELTAKEFLLQLNSVNVPDSSSTSDYKYGPR